MKYTELLKKMREFNVKHNIERKVDYKHKEDGTLIRMVGKVVIKNECLKKVYPLEQRTYTFDNYNKALTQHDLGYSVFAVCEADDDCMRIENGSDNDFESAEIVSVTE